MTPRELDRIHRSGQGRFLLLLVSVFLWPSVAPAWPTEVYRNIAYDTLRLAPPSLARVLWRNDEHLLRGVYQLEGEVASTLARSGLEGTLTREIVHAVGARVELVADMVSRHRPFREVAFELGKLIRIAADLADPTVVGAGKPRLAAASPEIQRFVTLHMREIPLVLDRNLPSTLEGASVSQLLQHLAAATEESADRLADAFWTGDRVVPAEAFDFRSVPFAEVSLEYSRGVTAASLLSLAAWSMANGDFTGYRFLGDKPLERFTTSQTKKEWQ